MNQQSKQESAIIIITVFNLIDTVMMMMIGFHSFAS